MHALCGNKLLIQSTSDTLEVNYITVCIDVSTAGAGVQETLFEIVSIRHCC